MALHRSRRSFLGGAFTAAATAALMQAQPFVTARGWLAAAQAAPDLTHDTVNGLLAFVLPGSDAWSIAQGVSTADQGGVDADNSALANGIGGPNPTLTTQAIATRTAERIFTRYFGGGPWVRAESPVSSIDPKVTHAVVRRLHA